MIFGDQQKELLIFPGHGNMHQAFADAPSEEGDPVPWRFI
jgi:hypothetical protein